MMDLPDQITDSEQDDFQTSDLNITNLVNKFIVPIEQIRSIAAPAIFSRPQSLDSDDTLVQRNLDTAQLDNSNPQESRCHAFYRMLGLPVVSSDYQFYNPGFNPKRGSKAKAHNQSVNSKISNAANLMAQFRESSARKRLTTFKKVGLDNSVYALVLPFLKSFNVIGSVAWDQQDNQSFTINARKNIANIYTKSNGSEITELFTSGTHVLRPFVVNPSISETTMPANRLICEPFLKSKNDTQLEDNVFLYRPGIEYILRLRLKESSDDDLFKSIIFTLDSQQDVEGFSTTELKTLAEFLLQENKLTSSIDFNTLELTNVNKLIKQVKYLIDLLIDEIENIVIVSQNIDWTPLCNENGPEFGTNISNFVIKKRNTSELEQRIKELKVLKQKAELSRQSDSDIGKFSLTFFDNTENLFTEELEQAQDQKDEYVRIGSVALQNIEYIVGEISGLGLIDIISIYMALWAVDLDVLLSMLDDNAFARLYDNNPNLRNSDVESRNYGGPAYGIFEAIQIFDSQVSSILAYIDKLLESRLSGIFNYTGTVGKN